MIFFGPRPRCLSPSHRLTQIFILHRVYRTPQFLYAIGLKSKPACARCGNASTLIHLLLRCPKRQRYWAEVIGTLNGLLDTNIPVERLICILGYCNTSIYTSSIGNTMRSTLFVARRQKWTSPHPLTVSEWILDLNRIIFFEKHTYSLPNSMSKFDATWSRWL